MPGQGRLGDKANVPLDIHGCPACPHAANGPAIQGSPDVNVNRRPALRVGDPGIHAACCGTNTWTATKGSITVLINGKGAHRMGDQNGHCRGIGQLVEGSPNVIVGESGGGSEAPGISSTSSEACRALGTNGNGSGPGDGAPNHDEGSSGPDAGNDRPRLHGRAIRSRSQVQVGMILKCLPQTKKRRGIGSLIPCSPRSSPGNEVVRLPEQGEMGSGPEPAVGTNVRRGLEASHHPRQLELGDRTANRGWIRERFAAFRCSPCKRRKWRRKSGATLFATSALVRGA